MRSRQSTTLMSTSTRQNDQMYYTENSDQMTETENPEEIEQQEYENELNFQAE